MDANLWSIRPPWQWPYGFYWPEMARIWYFRFHNYISSPTEKIIFFSWFGQQRMDIYIYIYIYIYNGALNIQKKKHTTKCFMFFLCGGWSKFLYLQPAILGEYKQYFANLSRTPYLSRNPCWATIPLMKIHSSPAKSHQITTDNFFIALQTCS